MIEQIYNDFTTWLRSFDSTLRLTIIGAFIVIACLCLIKFLNKSVEKTKMNGLYLAIVILCVICIIFLSIYS